MTYNRYFSSIILLLAGTGAVAALPYQLDLSPPASGGDVFVAITVPAGVTPSALSHDGIFDLANRTMKWGPIAAGDLTSIGFELTGGTGSLAVSSFPAGAAGMASIPVLADSDGDGLSDEFESTYSVADPGADDDGDGFRNLEEQALGTNPGDARSRLYARSVAANGATGEWEIRIPAEIGVAGLRVETSPALTNVVWRGIAFTSAFEGSDLVLKVKLSGLSGARNFFRVVR